MGKNIYCADGNLSALRTALRTALQTALRTIFLKFKYDNKKDLLIPNMVFKSVRGFLSKVMSILNLKIGNFKTSYLLGKMPTAGAHQLTFFSLRGPASTEGAICSDGWVGWDQKGPSIFLILKYITKQNVLNSKY